MVTNIGNTHAITTKYFVFSNARLASAAQAVNTEFLQLYDKEIMVLLSQDSNC